MNETAFFIARHGYWLLVLALLGKQACLPIPASLFVLAAGALAHSGMFSVPALVGTSVVTFLLADLAWYEVGRRSGDGILRFVCSRSRDPQACVNRATAAFASHGLKTLLGSKFVLGLDAVAAPLAGVAKIPRLRFLVFDALGATLWTTTFAALGYVFSDQLDLVGARIARIGASAGLVAFAVFGLFLVRRFFRRRSLHAEFGTGRITPEQLRDKLMVGEDILILDMRRAADDGAVKAIPGAIRIDPERLEQYKDVCLSPRGEVVLYSAGSSDFTSTRVALALRQKGLEDVHPLVGGLRGWLNCGFPVTSELRVPPTPAVWVSAAAANPSHR